jgi:hypothetical protein
MAIYSAFQVTEAPLHILDGFNITAVPGPAVNVIAVPAGGLNPDSLLVTNVCPNDVIRVTVNPVTGMLQGNRAFLVYPGQSISWTFEVENPIASVQVETVSPATGSVSALTPSNVNTGGNISIVFFEK